MSIQPDSWIKKMCKQYNMIEPFIDHQVSEGKISYGLSSMGYDVRISDEYRIFTNVNNSLVDPKNFSDENFVERKGPYCIIPPNAGTIIKPNITPVLKILKAVPRDPGFIKSAINAADDGQNIAAPTPCNDLKTATCVQSDAIGNNIVEIAYIDKPITISFFLPILSDNFPNGITKKPRAIINDEVIIPICIPILAPNSVA